MDKNIRIYSLNADKLQPDFVFRGQWLGTGAGNPGLKYTIYASLLSILILLIVCILEMRGSVLCLDAYPHIKNGYMWFSFNG